MPALEEAGLDPYLLPAAGAAARWQAERLTLCAVALVDLTGCGSGACLALGARLEARPGATVVLCAQGEDGLDALHLPVPVLPYALRQDGGPAAPAEARKALAQLLAEAAGSAATPVDKLVNQFNGIQHTKTDVFRDQAGYSRRVQEQLAAARRQGADGVRAAEARLGEPRELEAGVLIDLMLSYRAVKAWSDVVRLAGEMPPPLASSAMVREQLAFALNRAGRGEEAEAVLQEVLAEHGPSSETWALLGRVYKDRWDAAVARGDGDARHLLDQAIAAYLHGFEADWRDALPGINTVTLMTLREPPDPRRQRLIQVVDYAVERRIAGGTPDYWDYASRVELAALAGDRERALAALREAQDQIREVWEPETTRRNMLLIAEALERRGEPADLVREIEQQLAVSAAALA